MAHLPLNTQVLSKVENRKPRFNSYRGDRFAFLIRVLTARRNPVVARLLPQTPPQTATSLRSAAFLHTHRDSVAKHEDEHAVPPAADLECTPESITVTVPPPEPPTTHYTLASTQSESTPASKPHTEPGHLTATLPIPPTPIPKPLDNPRRPPGPSLALTSSRERIVHVVLNDAETIVIRPSSFQPVTLIVPSADLRTVLVDLDGRDSKGKRAGRTTVVEKGSDGAVTTRRVRRKRGREERDVDGDGNGDVDTSLLSEMDARIVASRENERRGKVRVRQCLEERRESKLDPAKVDEIVDQVCRSTSRERRFS